MSGPGTQLVRPKAGFAISEAAATILVLAVSWLPLIGLTCLAVEYGHALKVRSELQDAVDAAAVAGAARVVIAGDTGIGAIVRSTLDAHLRKGLKGIDFGHAVQADTLDVRIDARVATWLTAAFGKAAFHFSIVGSADLAHARAAALSPELARGLAEPPENIEAELLLERSIGNLPIVTSGLPSG